MRTDFLEKMKLLRNESGAGMIDCKRSLKQAKGDIPTALKILREQGLLDYINSENNGESRTGFISVYSHGRIGVMVEIDCQSDFAKETTEFQQFAKKLALHIVAYNPRYVRFSDVPFSEVKLEEELWSKKYSNKAQELKDKIVKGKMAKFYSHICLEEQQWIDEDADQSVIEAVADLSIKLSEKVNILRFIRWEIP